MVIRARAGRPATVRERAAGRRLQPLSVQLHHAGQVSYDTIWNEMIWYEIWNVVREIIEVQVLSAAIGLIGIGICIAARVRRAFTKGSGWTANSVAGDRAPVKTESMFSRLMQHGSQFFMEGVKNLVVKKHVRPARRAAPRRFLRMQLLYEYNLIGVWSLTND